jgi:phosphatidylglycerophosphate synthase
MLDTIFRRQTDGYLSPVAARLVGFRVRPGALTTSAFVCNAVALLDIGHRAYLFGLGFLVLGRLFDMLDGPVARKVGASAFGAYLDFTLDLIVSAGIPFAFALAEPDRALAAMFLMLGLVARAGAMAGAVRAKTGNLADALGWAGLLIGKSELFVAFALACVFPNWFSIIAYAIGILCFIQAGSCVASAATNRQP